MTTRSFGFLSTASMEYPENLFFVDSEFLIENIISVPDRFSENQKIALVSELLIRYFLKPSEIIKKAVRAFFSDNIFDEFDNSCNTIKKYRAIPENLFSLNISDSFLERIECKTHTYLFNLLNKTDGFIIAISSSEAAERGMIIPFELTKCKADEISVVADLDNNVIPQWSESLQKLDLPMPYKVTLCFHSSQLNIQDYTGDSLQFPLYMAYLRKIKTLPNYNHLRLFFSGQIENSEIISHVAIKGKNKALIERFSNTEFVCCSFDKQESESDSIYFLTPGSLMNRVQDEVMSIIEQNHLAVFEIEYITNRIEGYNTRTKKSLENHWDNMIQKLSTLLNNTPRSVYPDVSLSILVCISFAYCHSGQTEKAREFNRKAVEFAIQQERINDVLLLKIHEMIILLDEEKYEEIMNLDHDLKELLNSCDDNDLLLRYNGSLGQALMYGAVIGLPQFDSHNALIHLDEAIKYARRLPDKKNSLEEVAIDLNHKHSWYALFKPGSEEENDIYEQANKCSLLLPEENKKINLNFLAYQRGKAVYRRILKNESRFEIDKQEISLPYYEQAQDWVKALSKKYLGAYYCFIQDSSKAQEEFNSALDIIKNSPSALLQYIRMTIAAEAARSFCKIDNTLTSEYKNIARDIFNQNNHFECFPTSTPWSFYIDNNSEVEVEFPGLKYYY